MNLFKLKHFYSIMMLAGSLLIGLIGCKDFEDCRSLYTNVAWIGFKGEAILAMDSIYFEEPSKSEYPTYTPGNQKVALLRNLQKHKISIFLHPKHNVVSLLFYRTPTDPTNPPPVFSYHK